MLYLCLWCLTNYDKPHDGVVSNAHDYLLTDIQMMPLSLPMVLAKLLTTNLVMDLHVKNEHKP